MQIGHAGILGSLLGSTAAAAAMNGDAHAQSQWLPWITTLVSAFGPILFTLFLKWRESVREHKRAEALKELADGNPADAAKGKMELAEVDAEEKVLDTVQAMLKDIPTTKK